MFLNRCLTHFNKVNVRTSSLRSQPIAYFSSDETSKNDKNKKIVDKSAGNRGESSVQQKERIKNLLSKLSSNSALHIVRDIKTARSTGYKKVFEKQGKEKYKPKKTVDAVRAVASEIGGDKVANDLLHSINSSQDKDNSEDLDVVVAMMQSAKRINKKTNETMPSNTTKDKTPRMQYMGRFRSPTRELPSKDFTERRLTSSSLIFGGTPLEIFGNSIEHQDSLKIWNKLEQHELRMKMSYAPRNYFEKMAYWTEEGKIWKFPIDNEQGLDIEHQTPFSDHVFFEDLLEPWCPKKGAVRNFMELICIGLSKNPYLSVQEKREHIEWYKNYFNENSHILQKVAEQNELQLKQAATKLIE